MVIVLLLLQILLDSMLVTYSFRCVYYRCFDGSQRVINIDYKSVYTELGVSWIKTTQAARIHELRAVTKKVNKCVPQ